MNTLPTAVVERLDGLRRNGDGWAARCPAHDDQHPSLTLRYADDGKLLVHCHAGCDQQAIVDALGGPEVLRGEDRPVSEWTPYGDAVAVYRYVDEQGRHLYDVCRTADKQFPARRPDASAKAGWRWQLGNTRRVLYRLPNVLAAVAEGRKVVIVEGEKDVHSVEAIGRVATTSPGGAGSWRAEYAEVFRDADVTIIADADRPGQAHARQVLASLRDVARRVQVVEPAEGFKDISDQLAAGLGPEHCRITIPADEPVVVELAPDLHALLDSDEPAYDWLIPGLLERGDRLMLTGFEGIGKSHLLRQIAVCAAAGVHPFTYARGNPLRVLVLDCENSRRQLRRALRPLREATIEDGTPVPDGALRFLVQPDGIDLVRADDAAWLLERVTVHKPDLLILGPLYRLHTGNPNDEEIARAVVGAIDEVRVRCACAVALEAHQGHADEGHKRAVRPVGSSLYLRWPELGLGLKPAEGHAGERPRPQLVDLLAWRGFRGDYVWPERIACGSRWPWQEAL